MCQCMRFYNLPRVKSMICVHLLRCGQKKAWLKEIYHSKTGGEKYWGAFLCTYAHARIHTCTAARHFFTPPTHTDCIHCDVVSLLYRGVSLFNKLRVPVLGLIENMSYHQCVACGHKEHTFGQGGVQRTAADLGLDVLGEVRALVMSHEL
jgi:hypothetical protein